MNPLQENHVGSRTTQRVSATTRPWPVRDAHAETEHASAGRLAQKRRRQCEGLGDTCGKRRPCHVHPSRHCARRSRAACTPSCRSHDRCDQAFTDRAADPQGAAGDRSAQPLRGLSARHAPPRRLLGAPRRLDSGSIPRPSGLLRSLRMELAAGLRGAGLDAPVLAADVSRLARRQPGPAPRTALRAARVRLGLVGLGHAGALAVDRRRAGPGHAAHGGAAGSSRPAQLPLDKQP